MFKLIVILAITSLALAQTPTVVNSCTPKLCSSCALSTVVATNKTCTACYKSVLSLVALTPGNSECIPGTDTNCQEYLGPLDDNAGCKTCAGAFYPKDDSTKVGGKTNMKCTAQAAPVTGCDAYDSTPNCVSCITTSALSTTAPFVCTAIDATKQIKNCTEHSGDPANPTCKACGSGFTLDGTNCVATTTGCATGTDANCTSCQAAYSWFATDFTSPKVICTKFTAVLSALTLVALAFAY